MQLCARRQLAAQPGSVFTNPHFDGYSAMLIQLQTITSEHCVRRSSTAGWRVHHLTSRRRTSSGGSSLTLSIHQPRSVARCAVDGLTYEVGLAAVSCLLLDEMDEDPAQAVDGVLATIRTGFAERSPDGAGHFGEVAQKSLAMFASEPTMTTDDVAGIASPTLVLVGDDDLIELSHTGALYESCLPVNLP